LRNIYNCIVKYFKTYIEFMDKIVYYIKVYFWGIGSHLNLNFKKGEDNTVISIINN